MNIIYIITYCKMYKVPILVYLIVYIIIKHSNVQITVLILIHLIPTTIVMIKRQSLGNALYRYLLTLYSFYSKVVMTSSAAAACRYYIIIL